MTAAREGKTGRLDQTVDPPIFWWRDKAWGPRRDVPLRACGREPQGTTWAFHRTYCLPRQNFKLAIDDGAAFPALLSGGGRRQRLCRPPLKSARFHSIDHHPPSRIQPAPCGRRRGRGPCAGVGRGVLCRRACQYRQRYVKADRSHSSVAESLGRRRPPISPE
jgi:hypothetical protein